MSMSQVSQAAAQHAAAAAAAAGRRDPYATLLASCKENGVDPGVVAFVSLDTCGSKSPVRNCMAGAHLFQEVIVDALKINVTESRDLAMQLRDGVRRDLCLSTSPSQDSGDQKTMMQREMQGMLQQAGSSAVSGSYLPMRGRYFLQDVVGAKCVGTDVYRDKALNALKLSYDKAGAWQGVQFPIVFHLQWDAEPTPTGRPRMLFHVTFEPWKTAVGLALVLCNPRVSPPIQVRETPYKDPQTLHEFQSPRKYVIDWDMYVNETLGRCTATPEELTEDFLFDMFVRALSVMHAYMRKAHVLPNERKLYVSIKSRTRQCKNKKDEMDTKCSFHATVHVMEPADRHRMVICKVSARARAAAAAAALTAHRKLAQILDMVKKRTPLAIEVMNKRASLTSPQMLASLGDSAGFIAMDTAMTHNWHQPLQCIGSSKGDGIIFRLMCPLCCTCLLCSCVT